MRRTKIVCTLGPSTDKEEVLKDLMKNGMNVARMNFSHGTHEEQKARLDMIKKLRKELNLPVAALLDTKGPEIRIGDVEGGKLELKPGQEFTLTTLRSDHNTYGLSWQNGLQSLSCPLHRSLFRAGQQFICALIGNQFHIQVF